MHVPSEVRRVCVVLALAGLLPLSGCSKKAGADTSAPSVDQGAYADDGGDELAQLEAYEAQLRGLGVEPARARSQSKAGAPASDAGVTAKDKAKDRDVSGEGEEDEMPEAAVDLAEAPAPSAAEPEDASTGSTSPDAEFAESHDRCASLCMLSEAICELEVRICEMSEDHAGDASYADACERAIDDCGVSGDACNTCSP